jgi:hypothetical protein
MSLKKYELKKIIFIPFTPLSFGAHILSFLRERTQFLEPSGTLHTAFFGSKIYGPIRVVKQCATAHRPIHNS